MKTTGFYKGLLTALALGALVFLGMRVMVSRPSDKFSKGPVPVPQFSFQDRGGTMISNSSLKGKVWVADFIFARCAGSCPMLTHQFKILQDAWKGNSGLKLVTFTVDPDHDTPAVLKKYAEDIQADPDQWFFLTGPKKELYGAIRDGFKVTAQEDPQGEAGFEFIHTTRMMLVDGDGMIRGMYDGQDDEDIKKFQQDVRYLMSSHNHQ